MTNLGRTLLVTVALTCLASPAIAAGLESETPPKPDPARPAIGEWIGTVSWNAPIVTYGWTINPDGSFSSGRVGRGDSGGGEWGTHDAHLTLKYSNSFRYEGELHDNTYAGTAYRADGQPFGGFVMRRPTASDSGIDDDH